MRPPHPWPATRDEASLAKTSIASLLAAGPAAAFVAGIGLCRDPLGEGYAVKVNLRSPAPESSIPQEIDGVPVVSEVVGRVSKRLD